jgi:hypothetical protein
MTIDMTSESDTLPMTRKEVRVCECDGKDFSARAETAGEVRTLTVEGECTCPEAGFTLALEPDNPGIVPQPSEVILRLEPTPPTGGAEVMTLTPVEYVTRIGDEVERVVIRLPDGREPLVLLIEAPDGY